MNGRMYDANLGRFLSPDNYIQDPFNTQSFNRYGYVLSNPLKYVDLSGEFIGTLITALFSTVKNIFKHGVNFNRYEWDKLQNAWEIDKGMFTGNFGQVVNKWTWGILNTIAGNLTAHTLNAFGEVDGVTHLDGAVALEGTTGEGAFTIGQYIFGPDNFKADWKDHLFVHEYGHYIQSQWFGPLYLPVIGATSLASAAGLGGDSHETRWFEVQASKMGANHFDKKYGSGAAGYTAGSEDYFDRESYVHGYRTSYINPRYGTNFQGGAHPISGARFSIWDVLVPVAVLAPFSLIFI